MVKYSFAEKRGKCTKKEKGVEKEGDKRTLKMLQPSKIFNNNKYIQKGHNCCIVSD